MAGYTPKASLAADPLAPPPLALRERAKAWSVRHPVPALVAPRLVLAIFTLFLVSVAVFAATQVLPGNAARAILGPHATPSALHALDVQLGLNQPAVTQYTSWLGRLLQGHLGKSLATGQPVTTVIGPRLLNSAVLVAAAAFIGVFLGVALGVLTASRRDGPLDHVVAIISLAVIALPEFVVGIVLILLFSTSVFHLLPAVSILAPGQRAWSSPKLLVLPVATLVIVIVPYIYRMVRATVIDALDSPYVEMAELKGMSPRRVMLVHTLPNALAPAVQTIGLNVLYLAGGIVVVEYLFNFPGIGQGIVTAVTNRDLPVLQTSVLALGAFYMIVNTVTDVGSLMLSPLRKGRA